MANNPVKIFFDGYVVVADERELGGLVYKGLDVSVEGTEATADVFDGKYGVVALVKKVKTDGEGEGIEKKVLNGLKEAVSMETPLVLESRDALTAVLAVPAFYLDGLAYAPSK